MEDYKLKNELDAINATLTDDFLKNLSDEQLNEISELLNEIDAKLQAKKH